LIVLETVSAYPSGPLWKLNLVEDDEDIGMDGLEEEAWEGSEVWLIGGEDHRQVPKVI